MTGRTLQLAISKRNEKAYNDAINHLRLVVRLFKNIKFEEGWKPFQTHIIIVTEAILELQDYLLNARQYDFVIVLCFGPLQILTAKYADLMFRHGVKDGTAYSSCKCRAGRKCIWSVCL